MDPLRKIHFIYRRCIGIDKIIYIKKHKVNLIIILFYFESYLKDKIKKNMTLN